jgi:hypothetical protein
MVLAREILGCLCIGEVKNTRIEEYPDSRSSICSDDRITDSFSLRKPPGGMKFPFAYRSDDEGKPQIALKINPFTLLPNYD